MSQLALLWGEDYPEYGQVGLAAAGDHTAIAISRGGAPKNYPSTDPNEDAVGAVVGHDVTLLICADGHNGFDSVRPAVDSVLNSLGPDPPPPGTVDMVDVFLRASDAALAVTQALEDHRRESRTALAVALVGSQSVQWGALGDAPVYVGSRDSVEQLSHSHLKFVGYPMSRGHLEKVMRWGEAEVKTGDAVVLASDGFSDYSGYSKGRQAIAQVLRMDVDPAESARALVEIALEGGAGDNVAVAFHQLNRDG